MTTIEIIAKDGAKIGSTFYPCGAMATTDEQRADTAVSHGLAVYAAYSTFKVQKKGKPK